MTSPTIQPAKRFTPVDVLDASKRDYFEKSIESYKKGVKVWILSYNDSWVISKISDCSVSYPDNKVVITLTREVVDPKENDFFLDKQSSFYQGGLWSAQPSKRNRELLFTFTSTISDASSDKTELPYLKNPKSLDGIQDLTNLSHLNGPSILHNLEVRYNRKEIYTYSGVVLVALNPYYPIDIYNKDTMVSYLGKKRSSNDPHLYALAEDSYNGMKENQRSQSIIIYGESGAGKTTSAKHIMRYFAKARHSSSDEDMAYIETQILATNPVFEAFGNAKTVRNDNSSRFGKYLEIFFDFNKQTIVGANNKTFLLERSRLTNLPESERNYHIFYQFIAGTSKEVRQYCMLDNKTWKDFRYLSKGGCGTIPNIDDAKDFAQTCEALELVGIDKKRQSDIWKVLAILLHIGNIKIEADKHGKSIDSFSKTTNFINVVELLGIDSNTFKSCLLTKKIVTQRESITVQLNKDKSSVIRDSIAKFLYSKLFDWILEPLNASLAKEKVQEKLYVGILDIYGFEYFESNSFEQLCINYANEKLQHHFNNHVFESEQEEYKREKLANWEYIGFHDNRPCIELLEGRIGVFAILDEESRLETGNDSSFVNKLYQQFDPDGNTKPESKNQKKLALPYTFFSKPRFSNTSFIIHHYATDVIYNGEGFLDKNKDSISDELMDLLKTSSLSFIKNLTQCDASSSEQDLANESGRSTSSKALNRIQRQSPTLGAVFRRSLSHLINQITSTDMHYIRCIKTNTEKKAWLFEPGLITQQLHSCGVLETIKISKAGYPSRVNIHVFNDRYLPMLPISTRQKLTLSTPHLLSTLRTRENPKATKNIQKSTFPPKDTKTETKRSSKFSSRVMDILNANKVKNHKVSTYLNPAMVVYRHRTSDFYAHSSAIRGIEKEITDSDRNLSALILGQLVDDPNIFQIGVTKVFFRAGHWANLEYKRTKLVNRSAIKIQKNVSMFFVRTKFLKIKRATSVIKSWWLSKLDTVKSHTLSERVKDIAVHLALCRWVQATRYVKAKQAEEAKKREMQIQKQKSNATASKVEIPENSILNKPTIDYIHSGCGLPFHPVFLTKLKQLNQEIHQKSVIKFMLQKKAENMYLSQAGIPKLANEDGKNNGDYSNIKPGVNSSTIRPKENILSFNIGRRWSSFDLRSNGPNLISPLGMKTPFADQYVRKASLGHVSTNSELFNMIKSFEIDNLGSHKDESKGAAVSENYCNCDNNIILSSFLKSPDQYYNLLEGPTVARSYQPQLLEGTATLIQEPNPGIKVKSKITGRSKHEGVMMNDPWSNRHQNTNQGRFQTSKGSRNQIEVIQHRLPLTENRVLNGVIIPGKSFSHNTHYFNRKRSDTDYNGRSNSTINARQNNHSFDEYFEMRVRADDEHFPHSGKSGRAMSIRSMNTVTSNMTSKLRNRAINVSIGVNTKIVAEKAGNDNKYRLPSKAAIVDSRPQSRRVPYSNNINIDSPISLNPNSSNYGVSQGYTPKRYNVNPDIKHNATTPITYQFGRHTAARANRLEANIESKNDVTRPKTPTKPSHFEENIIDLTSYYITNSDESIFYKNTTASSNEYNRQGNNETADSKLNNSDDENYISVVNSSFLSSEFDLGSITSLSVINEDHELSGSKKNPAKLDGSIFGVYNIANSSQSTRTAKNSAQNTAIDNSGGSTQYSKNPNAIGNSQQSGVYPDRAAMSPKSKLKSPKPPRKASISHLRSKVSRLFTTVFD